MHVVSNVLINLMRESIRELVLQIVFKLFFHTLKLSQGFKKSIEWIMNKWRRGGKNQNLLEESAIAQFSFLQLIIKTQHEQLRGER